MFKLVISDDEGRTTVVPLVREEITIGRKEGNTIRLTEQNVSREHARIRQEDDGLLLEDRGSYNGTHVNGERIDGSTSLTPGDQITIGDYQLAVQREAAESGLEAETTSPGGQLTPPARLVMLTQPAPGAEYTLSAEEIRLGRAEDLDVCVNHRSISREHARIRYDEEGALRIEDLGSANGMRINGKDSTGAKLQPGDELELGQVRFRFVGPGESYTFEGEQPMEAPAQERGEGRAQRSALAAALAILAAGGVAAGVIVFSGGSSDAVQPAPTGGPPDEPAASAAAPEGKDQAAEEASREIAIDEATRRCKEALDEERYEKAIAQADIALSHDPEHAGAKACREQAETERAAAEAFTRGRTALEEGDVDSAYFAFEALPEDSAYRDREPVSRAMEKFARRHVDKAERLLERRPAEASRHAGMVLTMENPPARLARKAERLRRKAAEKRDRRRGKAAAKQASGQDEGARAPASGAGATQAGEEASQGEAPSAKAGSKAGEPTPDGPMALARQCMMRGDNECVIGALKGRTKTPRQLALLIETYKTVGNHEAAARAMERFIERYPDDSRVSRYQSWLDKR